MSAPGPVRHEALFEEEALGKAYDARLARRLWRYIAPYRAQVLVTVLMLFPLMFFELAPAWIIKTGIDHEIVPRATGLAPAPPAWPAAPALVPEFAWSLAQSAVAALSRALEAPAGIPPLAWLAGRLLRRDCALRRVSYIDPLVMSRTGQAAMRDLRREVFAHIQRLHLGFFDTMPVGRLVTRATNDVENVSEMFSAGIAALVRDVFKMLGLALALFCIDARLAGFTFLVVPLLAVGAFVFRWKVREAFRAVRVRIARINAYLQENVVGMKVVQLFTREAEELPRLRRDERRPPRRLAPVDPLRLGAVRGGRVRVRDHDRAGDLAGRGLRRGRHDLPVHRLDAAVLPAAARSLGEVLGDAVVDGERRADLRAARHARPRCSIAPEAAPPIAAAARRGAVEFDRVWFSYRKTAQVARSEAKPSEDQKTGCCATCRSASSPGRARRSSARPGRARRRSSSC